MWGSSRATISTRVRGPARVVDRICGRPDNPRPVRPVESRVQGVAGVGTREHLVVRHGAALLLVGVERLDADDLAVGKLPQTRASFVAVVVDPEVLILILLVALSAIADACEEDLGVVAEPPFARDQDVPLRPARFVDARGGDRPVRLVEHRFVQRCKEALEEVRVRSPRPCPRGPSRPCDFPRARACAP